MSNEESIKEAGRILARGGRLVVAKNVRLGEPQAIGGLPLGVKVQVCEWLPDDTVIAIAPEMDSDRLALKFATELPTPEPAPAAPETRDVACVCSTFDDCDAHAAPETERKETDDA